MDALSNSQLETFSDALYALNAADSHATLIHSVLSYLPRLVSMDSCTFFPIDDNRWHFCNAMSSHASNEAQFLAYQSYYEQFDDYKRAIFAVLPRPMCDRSSDYMDYSRWAMNPHRAEFLLPNGKYHLAGIQIFTDDHSIGTCAMYRDVGTDFSDSDMLLLRSLQRHISAAFTRLNKVAAPLDAPRAAKVLFTAREREIGQLLPQGLSYQHMAEQLHISANTVKTHITHMLAKTGCRNRTELTYRICSAPEEDDPTP